MPGHRPHLRNEAVMVLGSVGIICSALFMIVFTFAVNQ